MLERAWRYLGADFKVRRRRLTDRARQQILRALARGVSSIALGERYGVNPATVRKIRLRARENAEAAA